MSEFATLDTNNASSSQLMQLFFNNSMQPGTQLSYQDCKVIYAYHPLGKVLADKPIEIAQSQKREITIDGSPDDDLVKEFKKVWEELGCDKYIASVISRSRIYGLSSIVFGAKGVPTDIPLSLEDIEDKELYFNVVDPLNTAGSQTFNQDPNSPDFLKPNHIDVSGQRYHSSRACTAMNEDSLYILFTTSAFGYTGRSVYQRALYPLQTFILSMLTDNFIIEKSGLIVWKGDSPGSMMDNVKFLFGKDQAEKLKGAKTNNVFRVGREDDISSINLNNLEAPTKFARDNVLKNVATSANMPASIVNQETLADGFGEGQEDAKNIARYIETFRNEMNPVYHYFDRIVQRKAWGPTFYESMKRKHPNKYTRTDKETGEIIEIPYETAFYEWKSRFKAVWPNLLIEPDSEKIKTEEVKLKSSIAVFSELYDRLDPENKSRVTQWLSDQVEECKLIGSSPLDLDIDSLKEYNESLLLRSQQATELETDEI